MEAVNKASIRQQDEKIAFVKQIEKAILMARDAIVALQNPDGCWCFELEADCTIPAEYILMMHYMGEIDKDLQAKIANYLRTIKTTTAGGPSFPEENSKSVVP